MRIFRARFVVSTWKDTKWKRVTFFSSRPLSRRWCADERREKKIASSCVGFGVAVSVTSSPPSSEVKGYLLIVMRWPEWTVELHSVLLINARDERLTGMLFTWCYEALHSHLLCLMLSYITIARREKAKAIDWFHHYTYTGCLLVIILVREKGGPRGGQCIATHLLSLLHWWSSSERPFKL